MISKAVKVAGEVTYEKGYWLKNLTLVYSDVTKGRYGGMAPPPTFGKIYPSVRGGGQEKIREGMVG